MNITLTGSLGRIGEPLTKTLISQGHTVTVISSKHKRKAAIVALGATAAIGDLNDINLLASTFTGSDVAYVMAPPANYFDPELDLLKYFRGLGHSFAAAAKQSGVKRIINLSSIGAHMDGGNGILKGTYHVEQSLNSLPADVNICHIRPTSIYYNLFGFTEVIRYQDRIASNLGPDDVNVHVATEDIAAEVADEINNPTRGRSVRYVASEEATGKEVATTLGVAIGKPDLRWVEISDEAYARSLIEVGMQPAIAHGLTEMYAAIRTGKLYEHYRSHPPSTLGNVKLKDFAKTFAVIYNAPR